MACAMQCAGEDHAQGRGSRARAGPRRAWLRLSGRPGKLPELACTPALPGSCTFWSSFALPSAMPSVACFRSKGIPMSAIAASVWMWVACWLWLGAGRVTIDAACARGFILGRRSPGRGGQNSPRRMPPARVAVSSTPTRPGSSRRLAPFIRSRHRLAHKAAAVSR